MTFEDMFRTATASESGESGADPYPYQTRFASESDLPSLLNVPTGAGKTATAILGWLYRRRFHPSDDVRRSTPRRLVYCLPMRTLVEQTSRCAVGWLKRLGVLAEYPGDVTAVSGWALHNSNEILPLRIAVSLVMGGEERADWHLYPECDAILIGTQDMLLSRALNRGYAARRPHWPIEFGLLLNDSLWVVDEVQLMGSGLATTAQIDGFAKRLWEPAKPLSFLWMSATLGDSFLHTRDRKDWGLTGANLRGFEQEDLDVPAIQQRLLAEKTLQIIKDRPKVAKVLDAHSPGRISLLILNTVPAAKSFYQDIQQELTKAVPKGKPKRLQPEICLLHSRFRPMDREHQMTGLLAFLRDMNQSGAIPNSDGLIVVSTQVVEAGFDLSSVRL